MSNPSRPLPVALVTGASSGIGHAASRLLAHNGYRVFGTSRTERPDGENIAMLRLDVASEESVRACVSEVQDRAGDIDLLVNNAGYMQLGIVEETPISDAKAVFDTNLFGTVRMIDAVLPRMRERRSGQIINIGSLAAWIGEPGEAFYAASKRALSGYSEALHHELWPFGIAVSLLEPGVFKTGVLAAASESPATIPDYDQVRRGYRRVLEEGLDRGGDPESVARVILAITRARAPRFRYAAGVDARLLPYLTLLAPQKLVDFLLRKAYGLARA